jgi:phosphotransferase system HPr (HPr) family protein
MALAGWAGSSSGELSGLTATAGLRNPRSSVQHANCMTEEIKAVRTVKITNPQGLHVRPADLFVKRAILFESKIDVIKGNERVDGKSILAILMLAADAGTELRLEAIGPDAQAALDSLAELVSQNFHED